MAATLTRPGSVFMLDRMREGPSWSLGLYTAPAAPTSANVIGDFSITDEPGIDRKIVFFGDAYIDDNGRAVSVMPSDAVFARTNAGAAIVAAGSILANDESEALFSERLRHPTTGVPVTYTFTAAGQTIRVRYRLSLHGCLIGSGTPTPSPGSPGWMVDACMCLDAGSNGTPTTEPNEDTDPI